MNTEGIWQPITFKAVRDSTNGHILLLGTIRGRLYQPRYMYDSVRPLLYMFHTSNFDETDHTYQNSMTLNTGAITASAFAATTSTRATSTTVVDLTNVSMVNVVSSAFLEVKEQADLAYPLVGLSESVFLDTPESRVVRSYTETFPREVSIHRTGIWIHDFSTDFTAGADPCIVNSPATISIEFTGRAAEDGLLATISGSTLTVFPTNLDSETYSKQGLVYTWDIVVELG